jgi:hypothetical protein
MPCLPRRRIVTAGTRENPDVTAERDLQWPSLGDAATVWISSRRVPALGSFRVLGESLKRLVSSWFDISLSGSRCDWLAGLQVGSSTSLGPRDGRTAREPPGVCCGFRVRVDALTVALAALGGAITRVGHIDLGTSAEAFVSAESCLRRSCRIKLIRPAGVTSARKLSCRVRKLDPRRPMSATGLSTACACAGCPAAILGTVDGSVSGVSVRARLP